MQEVSMDTTVRNAGILIVVLLLAIISLMFLLEPERGVSPPQIDKLTAIQNRGYIVIATDPASPPLSELIPGIPDDPESICSSADYTKEALWGFDVAVGVAIAERLGVEPCFVTPAWTRIVSGNWGDAWDISVGSMSITSERMKHLYFTRPYNAAPALFFVSRDNPEILEPEDLSGRRIGVCAGCIQERYVHGDLTLPGEDIRFLVKNATPVAYNFEALAFADLVIDKENRLDAVIADAPMGMMEIAAGSPIRALDTPAYYSYFAVAADKKSKNDPIPLVARLSDCIREMHEDNTLKDLADLYLSEDYTGEAALFDYDAVRQI